MIIDKIENYKLYNLLGQKILRAFDFITKNDIISMSLGKYQIQEGEIYAIVTEYDTKEIEDCSFEAHKKYIDLQFMVSGEEHFGYVEYSGQKITKHYDKVNDYTLYKPDEWSLIKLKEGSFVIFFPEDLHMPCIKCCKKEKVKKIVIKILV